MQVQRLERKECARSTLRSFNYAKYFKRSPFLQTLNMYQSMNECISSDAWNILPSPSRITEPTGNEMHLLFIYLLIIYFSRTEVWTGSLAHTKSVLYHWTPSPALETDILTAQVMNCFLSSQCPFAFFYVKWKNAWRSNTQGLVSTPYSQEEMTFINS